MISIVFAVLLIVLIIVYSYIKKTSQEVPMCLLSIMTVDSITDFLSISSIELVFSYLSNLLFSPTSIKSYIMLFISFKVAPDIFDTIISPSSSYGNIGRYYSTENILILSNIYDECSFLNQESFLFDSSNLSYMNYGSNEDIRSIFGSNTYDVVEEEAINIYNYFKGVVNSDTVILSYYDSLITSSLLSLNAESNVICFNPIIEFKEPLLAPSTKLSNLVTIYPNDSLYFLRTPLSISQYNTKTVMKIFTDNYQNTNKTVCKYPSINLSIMEQSSITIL